MRVGHGFDVHRYGGTAPLILGGVHFDGSPGVEATSDGDVVGHAVIDAMLGAAALGDLGSFFPSDDPQWQGADSVRLLLPTALAAVAKAGWSISNLDCTVIAQSVRIAAHRDQMRENLADALHVGIDAVSIKATTTDRLGAIGRDEGIAASAVVMLSADG